MCKAEEILRSWTHEQLSVAATELATYTSEGEQQVRSEGHRRGLPDPPLTVRIPLRASQAFTSPFVWWSFVTLLAYALLFPSTMVSCGSLGTAARLLALGALLSCSWAFVACPRRSRIPKALTLLFLVLVLMEYLTNIVVHDPIDEIANAARLIRRHRRHQISNRKPPLQLQRNPRRPRRFGLTTTWER